MEYEKLKARLLGAEVQNYACPATWDGWQCFDTAEAGTVVEAQCPPYIYGEAARPDASQIYRLHGPGRKLKQFYLRAHLVMVAAIPPLSTQM
ncbi:hypothetical protein COOONC_27965 [Cooperia oncophora]